MKTAPFRVIKAANRILIVLSEKEKIQFSAKQQKLIKELFSGINNEQADFIGKFLVEGAASKSFMEVQAVSASAPQLFILYGSESGNAENLAAKAKKFAAAKGFKATMQDMLATKPADLVAVKNLLVVVSTWGEGDPPERAVEFFKQMKASGDLKLPSENNFAVLALGDTSYVNFCKAGKDVDAFLEKAGASRILDRIDCDVDFEKVALEWLENFFPKLMVLNGIDPAAVKAPAAKTLDIDAVFGFESPYTQSNPYEAVVKEKVLLNEVGSEKETYHIEIDLSGSGIRYNAGDALGLYPVNDAKMVADILKATGLTGAETHDGKSLKDLLTYEYDINAITKPVIDNYLKLTNNAKLKEAAADIEKYTYGREVIDMLKDYPHKGITAVELLSILRKLPHRLYSISSSNEYSGEEVHLTVATVRYDSYGRVRKGVASGFLADDVAAKSKVRVFVKPNKNFRLPENGNAPVIMVGPGTGIAPFRAFLQQRDIEGAKGKNWLIFGEQRYLLDFFYQVEWQEFKEKGLLTNFDAAFSRDQPEKIYVQNKMWDRRKELYDWLQQDGYFYVCGDEKRMAKDVDNMLHKVIADVSGKGDDFAKDYVHKMKLENRYLRDVY